MWVRTIFTPTLISLFITILHELGMVAEEWLIEKLEKICFMTLYPVQRGLHQ